MTPCSCVGFTDPAGQRVLAPTRAALENRHPEVRTSLVPRASFAQLSELREGRVDVALVFGAVPETGLCQRPIFTLSVVEYRRAGDAGDVARVDGVRVRGAPGDGCG
ncbi:LysR substrate-binding domain-containing protein [Cryptosporangium sp. NPDC048952]|uniref:LysR substrate-binding domain-containing protein n=1 Tax=Cryptosporangium sp. NPDC048952 TaxID=3363961 RepID=UPI00371AC16A